MKEDWTIDEDRFVSNGKVFFHISDLKGVVMPPDTSSVDLLFFGYKMSNSFEDTEDHKKFFDLMTGAMKEWYKLRQEHEAMHHKMHTAGLEIQNRIAGKFIGGCDHI